LPQFKAQVAKEAGPMMAAGGISASNTSTLPISGLARASAHPEKFIKYSLTAHCEIDACTSSKAPIASFPRRRMRALD